MKAIFLLIVCAAAAQAGAVYDSSVFFNAYLFPTTVQDPNNLPSATGTPVPETILQSYAANSGGPTSYGYSASFGGGTYQGYGFADSSSGALRASTGVTLTDYYNTSWIGTAYSTTGNPGDPLAGYGTPFISYSWARIQDDLNVQGVTGYYDLTLQFQVDGVISDGLLGLAVPSSKIVGNIALGNATIASAQNTLTLGFNQGTQSYTPYAGMVNLTLQNLPANDPLQLDAYLYTELSPTSANLYMGPFDGQTYTGTASVDFSNTAKIVGAQITQGGIPVHGATIEGASGLNYLTGQQTPEPSTLALLAAGVCLLPMLRRQRRGI